MAYNAFGEYTGGQRDPLEEERIRQEEEERKRREEAEQLARLGQVAGGPGVAGGEGSGTYYDAQGRLIVMEPGSAPVAPDADPLGAFAAEQVAAQQQRATRDPDPLGSFAAARVAESEARAAAQPVAPVDPDTVVKKEQVETRADGTRVVKTEQEVAVAPVASAAPVTVTAAAEPPRPAATAKPPGTPPAALPGNYNQRIAQMESGGRADIGYHDRSKSTAYGPYGITDKAFKDAQRNNPDLAGLRIEQLNPTQMQALQNTVTGNNSKYLTKLGVEVTPNTLAAAHFIGAQGLANYLRDGSISEGAAKANGGYDKTKRIIDGRLAIGSAPASGAATQAAERVASSGAAAQAPVAPVAAPAPEAPVEAVSPYSLANGQTNQGLRMPTPAPQVSPAAQAIDAYQAAQSDPMALLKLRTDESVPAFIRDRAGQQAYELLNRERKTAQAETQVAKMVESGDQMGIAKAFAAKPKDEDGSIFKAVLYARFGLTDLAAEEQRKLGAGSKWTSVSGPDGEPALVKVSANGKPLEGVTSSGAAMSENDLVKFGSGGGALGKGISLSAEVYQDPATGARYRSGYDASGKSALVNIQGGAAFRGDPKTLRIQSIDTATQKAEGAAAVKLRYAGPTSYTEAGARAAGEFNFNNGTNIGYASQAPGAPLVDLNTGKPVAVNNGVITATQSGTPGAAAPAAAPVRAPGTAPAVTGQTPAQITSEREIGKVGKEQFVKTTVPAVLEQGNNGRDIATARRQQVAIIENNPSILDIYNGSGDSFDRGRNVISKLLTGAYNENNSGDFYKDVKGTGLGTNERSALEQMWNLTSGINGKTLKTNTGGGPISNADMKTNQAANLQNFTETTPLGALQVINRSKFTGDLDTAKAAFIAKNPGLNDDVKFADAWSKESARYTKAYEGISDARAQFLKPFAPPKNATKEQLSVFRDKVFKSFEMYPVPAYDADTAKWSYGTANAERAAAKKLLGR